ncbi:MAG: efflux RND transporter periplasmic adaptor subunit [Blastocatellia bacterium]
MKTIIKRILLSAVVLVTIVVIGIALRPVPEKVEAARVQRGPLRATIDAEGKTRVRDRFVIAAPVTGRLTRIELHRGDQVQSGAVVARLDPLPMSPLDPRQVAEARARVAAAEQLKNEAEAGVAHVRADCEQAQREAQRAERLIETGDISRQDFERLRNADQTCRQQLEAAHFKARAAAAEVEVARAALIAIEQAGQSGKAATVLVHAPVSGKVLRVNEESERVIAAGAPLIEISNQTLEIVIDVLSADAVKVKPGAQVLIEGWGGEQPLQARVRLIEPSAFTKISALGIEEQRVNVIADFTDAAVPLGDGYRVEARIVTWETNDALKVPLSALFRQGRDWNVFVIKNGLAERRTVETGHRSAFEAEVLKGLQADEQVIVHPASQISDGVRVAITQQ